MKTPNRFSKRHGETNEQFYLRKARANPRYFARNGSNRVRLPAQSSVYPSMESLFDGDLSDPPDSDEEAGPRKNRRLDAQCSSDGDEESDMLSSPSLRKLLPTFPPKLANHAKTNRRHLGLPTYTSSPGGTSAFVSSTHHPRLQLAPNAQVQSRELHQPPHFYSVKPIAHPDPQSPTKSKGAPGVLEPVLGKPSLSTSRLIDAEVPSKRPLPIDASTTTTFHSENSRRRDEFVIISLRGTRFPFLRSTLVGGYKFFRDNLEGAKCMSPHSYVNDKTPMFEVDGDPEDFTELKKFVDSPFGSERDLATLLPIARAADKFGMSIVLQEIEPDFRKLFPPDIDSACSYIENRHRQHLDLEAIVLATQCPSLSFVLKPAMYKLLCQPNFLPSISPSQSSSGSITYVTQLGHHQVNQLNRARSTMFLQWSALCVNEVPQLIRNAFQRPDCKCSELGELRIGDFPNAVAMKVTQQALALSNWMSTLHRPPSLSPFIPIEDTDERHEYSHHIPTIHEIGTWDIIGGIQLLIDLPWSNVFCQYCEVEEKARWKERQKGVWELLDGYFATDS